MPHHENEGHPPFFRTRNIFLFGLAVVLLVVVVFRAQELFRSTDIGAAVITSMVLDLENAVRRESRLPELRLNETLSRAAREKASDMIARGYFAHETPDGEAPWKFIDDAGYVYVYAGENLALDFGESADVVSAWLNSKSHRENVLGYQYRDTGIAVVEGTYQGARRTFVVQMFGTSAPAAAVPAIQKRVESEKVLSLPDPRVLGSKVNTTIERNTVRLAERLPRAIVSALLVCMLMLVYSLYHLIHGPYSHRYYAMQAALVMLFMVGSVTVIAPAISKKPELPKSSQGASFSTFFE